MIKYRAEIDMESDNESTIIVEDGGVAFWHDTGEYILMEYCHTRITEETTSESFRAELAEGKQSCNEFPCDTPVEELIEDALLWLVCPSSMEDFELDNSIFPNIAL